jgi:hypothetical protein
MHINSGVSTSVVKILSTHSDINNAASFAVCHSERSEESHSRLDESDPSPAATAGSG